MRPPSLGQASSLGSRIDDTSTLQGVACGVAIPRPCGLSPAAPLWISTGFWSISDQSGWVAGPATLTFRLRVCGPLCDPELSVRVRQSSDDPN